MVEFFAKFITHDIFIAKGNIIFAYLFNVAYKELVHVFSLVPLFVNCAIWKQEKALCYLFKNSQNKNTHLYMHRTWAETHSTAVCYSAFWKRRKINTFIEFVDSCVMTRHSWMLQLLHTCVISNKWSVHIFCAGETLITQCKRDHHAFTLYDVVAN